MINLFDQMFLKQYFSTKTTLLKRIHEIPAIDTEIQKKCRFRIDNLTKPIYSLGRLEEIAEHLSGILKEVKPTSVKKKILVVTSKKVVVLFNIA